MFPANRNASLDSPPNLDTPNNSEASSYTLSSISEISTANSSQFGSVNSSIFDAIFLQNQRSVSFVAALDPDLFESHSQINTLSLGALGFTNSFGPLQRPNFAIDSGAERALFARKEIAPSSEPTRLLEPIQFEPALPTSNRRDQLSSGLSSWVSGAASRLEKVEREIIRYQLIQCFDSYQPDDELIIKAEHVTELPECIGIVWHIKKLDLSGCRSLKSLPNVLHNFMRLDVLNLTNCSSLKALPPTVTALNGFAALLLNGSGVSLANPINSRLLTSPPHQPDQA